MDTAVTEQRERDALIALNMVAGVGSIKLSELLRCCGGAAAVFERTAGQLQSFAGIGAAVARRIVDSGVEPGAAEARRAVELGVDIITLADSDYPALLRQLYDPPLVLYVQGTITALSRLCVAVVGCRRASIYGLQQASRLAAGLAACGITVVSGLARGIDTAAHRGVLDAGGITAAVCGCGLHTVYPAENAALAGRIRANGAVISEYPLGMPPLAGNFPRRNRLISGLSQAVLVVEAAQRSGSLITARLALEQGKDVLAVPGPANSPTARGTNQLIRQGARLVETVRDIIEELNLPALAENATSELPAAMPLDEIARGVLAVIDGEPRHIDDITARCGRAPTEVLGALLRLQLRGLVQESGGKRFSRRVAG